MSYRHDPISSSSDRKIVTNLWSRRFRQFLAATLAAIVLAACASGGEEDIGDVGGDADHPSVSTVRRLIGFIRYERDDRALQLIATDDLARQLLGPDYERATPAQRTQFVSLLGEYIRLNAFPTARRYFADIDISYGAPVIQGAKVRIPSSIVYAGSERLQFSWVLEQKNGQYQVVDFLNGQGVSSMQSSRDRQVRPLLRQGGIEAVNKKLGELVEELRQNAG